MNFSWWRVGGLQQKLSAGIEVGSGADRMVPRDQLAAIGQNVRQMVGQAYDSLRNEMLPALEKEGILLHVSRDVRDLTEEQRQHLTNVSAARSFPS